MRIDSRCLIGTAHFQRKMVCVNLFSAFHCLTDGEVMFKYSYNISFNMSNNMFDPTDPIFYGWNIVKRNIRFFGVLGVIIAGLYYLPALLEMTTLQMIDLEIIAIFWALIYLIIYQFVDMGLIGIAFKFYNEASPSIEDLFANYRLFPKYLAGSIIYMLVISAGFIFFILPGIYFALKYQFYGYLIIEKGMGPIAALKESSKMTDGFKKNLLEFWLILFCSIAVIMLLLSFFIMLPVSLITMAISPDLQSAFSMITDIISMIIKLTIVVPIIKLSMVYVYKIFLQHNAPEASPSESLVEGGNVTD